ncbi:hypothetical protein FC33_GL000001 [Ligilactobacillus aviarius subsp. aviarius DSM 20655]|nr:hypothetical protein FC33_GL000001 [Ligilactobacillus aviarius subsp. aviarius DSM 20655]
MDKICKERFTVLAETPAVLAIVSLLAKQYPSSLSANFIKESNIQRSDMLNLALFTASKIDFDSIKNFCIKENLLSHRLQQEAPTYFFKL